MVPPLVFVPFLSLFPGNSCSYSVCDLSSPTSREVQSLGLSLLAILNVNPKWLVESKGQSQLLWQEELSNQAVFLICPALSRLLTAQEDRQRENALQLEDISRRKVCCT